MLNIQEKQLLKQKLKEAFPKHTEQERDEMYQNLISYPNIISTFCTYIYLWKEGKLTEFITRVGIKYNVGKCGKGKYYYSTEYDTDMLDD